MKRLTFTPALFISIALASPAFASQPLTVDEVVLRALGNSDRIEAARAAQEGSRQQEKSARADRLPSLDASYGYMRFAQTPIAKIGGVERETSHDGVHKWQLTATQPLFTGFALEAKEEIARLDTLSLSEQTERTKQAIAAEAKIACYDVLLAYELHKVAAEAVKSLTEHRDNAGRFFEQGLQPRNELLKSEVALADAVQEKVRAQANLQLVRTRLALLADLDGEFELIPPTSGWHLTEAVGDYNELIGEALDSRPELKARRLVSEKLDSQEKAAKGAYLPKVNLIAAYERTGDSISASNNDYSNDHNTWVGVNLTMNIFDWCRKKSRINGVRASRNAEDALTSQLKKEIAVEVKQAHLSVQVARANIDTARSALEQARENNHITKLQYEQQLATSADVLDARTFLTRAETNYLGALYGHLSALTRLEFSVGRIVN
ncbi:MAG: hypothetical protein C0609_05315 [Deltaproteobacteria bacterium]|nr:MAG: hypothetical protein C0609_05315 [Deltaproteobacteria bacterium]